MKKYNLNIYKCKLVKENTMTLDTITDSNSVVDLLHRLDLCDAAEEYMYLICLNVKGNVVGIHEISHGDLCSTSIHPREVYKHALLNNAAGIIISHNHPSGDCTPSPEDIGATKRIKESGDILGIKLVDHIIVGGGEEYLSLQAEGLI